MNVSQTETVMKALHGHLGRSVPHRNGERSFHCPFCNHHKKKLQVNIETQKWHCWVCNAKGQTINSLLHKSDAPTYTFDAVRAVYGNVHLTTVKKPSSSITSLPKEYKALYVAKPTPHQKNAMHYAIHKRNLSPVEIVKYEVGYCESGPYGGMLIVPSYDEDGFLNYFVGRSFYDTPMKHKNPSVSKDVIGFGSNINWNEPVVIVEGAFDAITTRRNAIPLFGKKILPTLRARILQERPPKLFLALDPDAYRDTYDEIEYFVNNGIDVYYVNLYDKDPNETGHEGMLRALENAKQISFFDLIQFKMNL